MWYNSEKCIVPFSHIHSVHPFAVKEYWNLIAKRVIYSSTEREERRSEKGHFELHLRQETNLMNFHKNSSLIMFHKLTNRANLVDKRTDARLQNNVVSVRRLFFISLAAMFLHITDSTTSLVAAAGLGLHRHRCTVCHSCRLKIYDHRPGQIEKNAGKYTSAQ